MSMLRVGHLWIYWTMFDLRWIFEVKELSKKVIDFYFVSHESKWIDCDHKRKVWIFKEILHRSMKNNLKYLQVCSFQVFRVLFLLKIDPTDACLEFSEKTLFVMSLPMMPAMSEFVMFAKIFIIFGGIISRPVAFSGSNFLVILLIFVVVAGRISKISLLLSYVLIISYLNYFNRHVAFWFTIWDSNALNRLPMFSVGGWWRRLAKNFKQY